VPFSILVIYKSRFTLTSQSKPFDKQKSNDYISIMPSTTVEDYIKRLYLAEQSLKKDELVSMGEIASSMGVQAGTATSMVKTLEEAGLLRYEPRQGVRLTGGGKKLALHILRSHRLIELFLVETLGYDWSEVHDEAEKLEHVVSEKFLAKIDALMGHPETDPHGDPIPSLGGVVQNKNCICATQLLNNKSYTVSRVSKQETAFLNVLSEHNIVPGSKVICVENNIEKGTITLRSEKQKELVLSSLVAEHIFMDNSDAI
jgi:DtxR family transcriptional regulator, Mn-dependent transcriptional regulator